MDSIHDEKILCFSRCVNHWFIETLFFIILSQIYMIILSANFYFWLAEQAKIFINSHGARWLPTEYAFEWLLYIIYSKYTKCTIIIAGTPNKFVLERNRNNRCPVLTMFWVEFDSKCILELLRVKYSYFPVVSEISESTIRKFQQLRLVFSKEESSILQRCFLNNLLWSLKIHV